MTDLESIANDIELRGGSERGPGPIWGGWWFWEPPAGKQKETERK